MVKNGKVISIINMKGGVGKTALSVGISSFLAENRDKKILLIDSDPQFNATQAFIDPDKYEEDTKTIFQLFKPQTEIAERYVMPKKEELITNIQENLDILKGDLNLVLVNKSSDSGLIKRLKMFIKVNKLREEYDYIIIDCPPTLTLYTDSALISSDYYLIPNRIDRYSGIGIKSLNRAISDLIYSEDLELKCLGLVYTMVEDQLTQKQNDIKSELESSKAVEDIYIFSSNSSFVRDMQVGRQGPIAIRYGKSKKDISDIVDEMENRLSSIGGNNNG
ncbi:ParA family protein [Lactococcus lactis]|uniref:ParA family protein n=1 Tax=Lactococcus lactis TaxID=1358 RepID=UPI003D2ED995